VASSNGRMGTGGTRLKFDTEITEASLEKYKFYLFLQPKSNPEGFSEGFNLINKTFYIE
jgi:hypothetical protein